MSMASWYLTFHLDTFKIKPELLTTFVSFVLLLLLPSTYKTFSTERLSMPIKIKKKNSD